MGYLPDNHVSFGPEPRPEPRRTVMAAPDTSPEFEAFLAAVDLRPLGHGAWERIDTARGEGVIFGGRLLAHSVLRAMAPARG